MNLLSMSWLIKNGFLIQNLVNQPIVNEQVNRESIFDPESKLDVWPN